MSDEYRQLMDQNRFESEIEQGIRQANREIIHKRIPAIGKAEVLSLAVKVGRLRARYLEAAFKIGVDEEGDPPDQSEINELRMRREMFEEAREAFRALREAITRGYVDIGLK